MSKYCVVCGEKIAFLAENKLSKEHPKHNICFSCYEYIATINKGDSIAHSLLKKRYSKNISTEVASYISSLVKRAQTKGNTEKTTSKDSFIDMVSDKQKNESTNRENTNILRFDKLSAAKHDKLTRVKILSTICMFCTILFGALLSFYIFTQGYGMMLAIVMLISSVVFTIIFYCIRVVLSVVLDE